MSDATWMHLVKDFAVSGGISALAYGTTAFTAACAYTAVAAPVVGAALVAAHIAVAAPVVGAVVIGASSAVAGHYVYEWARDEVVEHFYEQPMDPTAEMAGRLVGGVAGGIVGAQLGVDVGEAIRFDWKYPNYVTYETETRALTEKTYAANRPTIDPNDLRGPANHLDHELSVRQGYEMHIPPAVIAAPQNLRIIPAPQNLSEGARLSPAVMHPADKTPVVRPAICVLGVLDWTRWCSGTVIQ
jgi:hypothetical protein